MTLQIILSVVLILLAAVFDSQRDKIQFDPLRSWLFRFDWWTERNHMEKKLGGSWLFDTVLSFLNDGWHFCKTMSLLSWAGVVVIWMPDFTGFGLWNVLIILLIYSLTFEISYKSKI